MADDALTALARDVLRNGLPEPVPTGLDAAHPAIPLAYDMDGDVAAVAVVARAPGGRLAGLPVLRMLRLERVDGEWTSPGGGGGGLHGYPLRDRAPAADRGGEYLRFRGAGSTLRASRDRAGGPERRIYTGRLEVAAEVAELRVGSRSIAARFHGHAVIVWAEPPAPTVVAVAADGMRLSSLDLAQQIAALPAPVREGLA